MASRTRSETERVLRFYEKEAHKYDREIRFFERLLFGGGREWVCAQATGDVLEIGIGTGRNLPHYRDDVRLTGIELSPAMLDVARARAVRLGREVDLRVGDAQTLDFPAESFDAAVCTLSLCTIPDDRRAVAEVRRVLRPGGKFVLLEHVRSPILLVRLGQRALEPLAVRFKADHLTREPLEHLRAQGFEVEHVERSKLGIVERVAARKPPNKSTDVRMNDERRSLRCSLPRSAARGAAPPAAALRSELCVCDLAWISGRPQNLVSHHLRVLRQKGLAASRREGKIVFYSLTDVGAELVENVLAAGDAAQVLADPTR